MLNKIVKKNLLLIILLCVFAIVCLLIKYTLYDSIVSIDTSVRSFVSTNIANIYLTKSMKIITNFSSAVGVLIVFTISILLFKDKIIKLIITLDMGLIGLLSLILKSLFSRPRPLDSIIKMPTSYSFPSGHTFFAVGLYGLITYFIFKSNINKYFKIALIIINILIIFLIGFSRIYLGVHHFTDVMGGLVFGLLLLLISINTYNIIKEEKR